MGERDYRDNDVVSGLRTRQAAYEFVMLKNESDRRSGIVESW